ncbi:Maf-like protein [archaeon]|nr:MAG: Maf-like protein [archaeon]
MPLFVYMTLIILPFCTGVLQAPSQFRFYSILKMSSCLQSIAPKIDLILGSGSQTRRDILTREGFNYRIRKANIDEKAFGSRSSDPWSLVRLLATEKANAILTSLSETEKFNTSKNRTILLTADQVVVCQGTILEKPVDEAEARKFIAMYNGGSCSTVGSIALLDLQTLQRALGVDSTTIYFRRIPEQVIDCIMAEGQAVHCAGGLMVEHPLLQPYIERIEGTVDSVMGLSCELLEHLFKQLGVD